MTIHQFEKRLRKLESTLRCEPDLYADFMSALLWFAVAYYLGNPSRDEKPFAAYARALGYTSGTELNNALEDNDLELLKRIVAAEKKLHAKLDCNLESEDWNKFGEALQRMKAGLPKLYMDQIVTVMTQAKISLAWLRNESGDTAAYIRYFA